jgi:hypothetical protein
MRYPQLETDIIAWTPNTVSRIVQLLKERGNSMTDQELRTKIFSMIDRGVLFLTEDRVVKWRHIHDE